MAKEDVAGDTDTSTETENENTETETKEQKKKAPEPKFTQDQVNKIAADVRRDVEKQFNKKLADFEKKITEAAGNKSNGTPDDDVKNLEPTDYKGRLEVLEKRAARSQKEHEDRLKAIQNQLEDERKKRRETERDKLLNEALADAGCKPEDQHAARKYFLWQIELEDDTWMFRTKGGNLVSLREGVSEELPPYWKPSTMQSGGSGTTGGTVGARVNAKKKQLEDAQKVLKQLYDKGKATNTSADIAAYQRQKKEVERLQKELASLK
jgi:hypothetical protein